MANRLPRVARHARYSGLLIQRLNGLGADAANNICRTSGQIHGNAGADSILDGATRYLKSHQCHVLADGAATYVIHCTRQLRRPFNNTGAGGTTSTARTLIPCSPFGKMSSVSLFVSRSSHPVTMPGALPVPGQTFVRGLSRRGGPRVGVVDRVNQRMENLHAKTVGRVQRTVENARASVIANLIRPIQRVYVDSGLSSLLTPASRAVIGASKAVIERPLTVLESYAKGGGAAAQRVARLQLTALWQRYYLFITAGGVVVFVDLLWNTMFCAASLFVNVSEGLAHFGMLGLAISCTLLGGLYWRARVTINPDALYRRTMRTLNASSALVEVMGAPIVGSDIRAYVLSGGGFKMRDFRPGLKAHRAHMICAVHGSEHKGLVSVAAKKKRGKYVFKLLAVDIPTAAGPEQRIYLEGGPAEYIEWGGLIGMLRDPLIQAMALERENEERPAQQMGLGTGAGDNRRNPEQMRREMGEEMAKVRQTVGEAAWRLGNFERAARLFERQVFAKELDAFLTLGVYQFVRERLSRSR